MADILPNAPELAGKLPKPVFRDPNHHIKIYQGDCLEILAAIPADCVDLIFADPPYFLSNDGITCHAGKMVSVNKGTWDKSKGPDLNHEQVAKNLFLKVCGFFHRSQPRTADLQNRSARSSASRDFVRALYSRRGADGHFSACLRLNLAQLTGYGLQWSG